MSDKIPTVEEQLQQTLDSLGMSLDKDLRACIIEDIQEFAKLHVKAALKTAADKAKIQYPNEWMGIKVHQINKDSILSAYPLTNIK